MNSIQALMSLRARRVNWRNGRRLTLYLLSNRHQELPKGGHGFLVSGIIGRIESKPPGLNIILCRGNDFVPVDSLRCVVVFPSLLIDGVKVVWIVRRALSGYATELNALF